MDLQLKGKRALVTGSSSGIGAAIALELAAEGVDIVVHGRDRERAEATARAVEKKGVRAAITIGDLMSDEAAETIGAQAVEAFGGIDILVNNAAAVLLMDEPKWDQVTASDWVNQYNLNVASAIRLILLLTPQMRERQWGRVVNISSTAAQNFQVLFEYGAAKVALNHMTISLSKELAKDGVTVNVVSPGTVVTPAVQRWLDTLAAQRNWPNDQAARERLYIEEFIDQPVRRLGQPRDIAAAVTMLASPLSGYTTGANLRIDGGRTSAM